jgi:hypothetical protein
MHATLRADARDLTRVLALSPATVIFVFGGYAFRIS